MGKKLTPVMRETLAPSALKIGFVSLGCPKNLVDSEVMMGIVSQGGAQITSRIEDADVIVVNTCSFIEPAKQESVDTILEMAKHKSSVGGNAKKLIVTGCLVERYRDEIIKNIPEVDAVLGTGELEKITETSGIYPEQHAPFHSPFKILGARREGVARESSGRFSRDGWDGALADLPNYLMDEHTPRMLATRGGSAYIKIAEGCDHPCSFCIIPQLRGKFRSRNPASVIAEARRLANLGIQEITLIGQDTTCYGEDLALADGLATLLEQLAQIEEIRWVRFLYAYPNKITNRLLETIAANPKVCSYLDSPLQHVSPQVLRNMKRGGSAELFLKSIDKTRKSIPDVTLRTSFIVGFPGETRQDFQLLCDFVSEARFDWMGVFGYSDEEGAGAHSFKGKIPSREIEQRKRQLMRLQKRISREKNNAMVGQVFDVIVEGRSDETDLLFQGRTERHAPEIDGKVLINSLGDRETVSAGAFYRCEITEAHDYDVVARVI